MQEQSFADVMAHLRAGDDEAAAQVFHRFAHRLIGLARSRLGPVMRQKVDPEDVLQSVFKSFFVRQAGGQVQAEDWDALWGMLVVITLRKCGRRVNHYRAARRDVRREVGHEPAGPSGAAWEAADPEPAPEEAAMLTETVEQLLASLEGKQREILTLSLQGQSVPEISAALGCTERTVYRVLERVKEWLQSVHDAER
jgi:RNA polymerase sigma-70 factor (ECF subfamily)